MLDKAGISYSQIDAVQNKNLTMQYGVKKAPTLLVSNGETVEKYENASEIKRFIEAR